eukprot:6172038-Pleurochrysis_carterae.AAC.1
MNNGDCCSICCMLKVAAPVDARDLKPIGARAAARRCRRLVGIHFAARRCLVAQHPHRVLGEPRVTLRGVVSCPVGQRAVHRVPGEAKRNALFPVEGVRRLRQDVPERLVEVLRLRRRPRPHKSRELRDPSVRATRALKGGEYPPNADSLLGVFLQPRPVCEDADCGAHQPYRFAVLRLALLEDSAVAPDTPGHPPSALCARRPAPSPRLPELSSAASGR